MTPVQRIAFCNQLVNTVEQKPQFLDQFIVSDDAVFSLNLEVNTRNVIRYSEMDICSSFRSVCSRYRSSNGMGWSYSCSVVLGPHFAEKTSTLEIFTYYMLPCYTEGFSHS